MIIIIPTKIPASIRIKLYPDNNTADAIITTTPSRTSAVERTEPSLVRYSKNDDILEQ